MKKGDSGTAAVLLALAALFAAANATAAGQLTSMKGEVRLKLDPKTYGPAVLNQRIVTGTTITTGPDSQAVIRFDDGQGLVLNENSEFKIADFRYAEANPAADRASFDL